MSAAVPLAPAAPALAERPTRPVPVPASDHVGIKEWLALFGAMLGAFMAVLNIQITNSSLGEIQGSLGATLDEGSWISTSYLVAEIIVIPLSAWLSQVFSIRWYLLVNTAAFLLFGALCATATDLSTMIVWRALQGFAGGVLIPMAFTIVLTTLPRSRQPTGMAMFAMTATFAPAIGPSIGGWLTDTYGWQYIFYMALVPGSVMLALLWYALPRRPMQLGLLAKGDWSGILCMVIGLASLEVVLEEGNRKDWLSSPLILDMSLVAFVFLSAFLVIELTRTNPLINLRLLTRRSFGLASVVNVVFGISLYGSAYLLPLYLSQMQGYNALQIGQVMIWIGVPQLIIIPLVPMLMRRVDARLLAGYGLGMFAFSCYLNSGLSPLSAGDQFIIPSLVRALGQAMVMPPLTALATAGIEREQAGSASALYNMMRNLGGSVGIALLSTFITKREQFHSSHVVEHLSLLSGTVAARIDGLTQRFLSRGVDTDLAREKAVAVISGAARQQAFTMAYADAFAAVGVALVLAVVAIGLCRKLPPGSGGAGGH